MSDPAGTRLWNDVLFQMQLVNMDLHSDILRFQLTTSSIERLHETMQARGAMLVKENEVLQRRLAELKALKTGPQGGGVGTSQHFGPAGTATTAFPAASAGLWDHGPLPTESPAMASLWPPGAGANADRFVQELADVMSGPPGSPMRSLTDAASRCLAELFSQEVTGSTTWQQRQQHLFALIENMPPPQEAPPEAPGAGPAPGAVPLPRFGPAAEAQRRGARSFLNEARMLLVDN
mmetsp:Transcript_26530/g.84132  ORF Transcript_26530/g.84132 Transcript_26530/m.84132 type:complete len:235 (+) Transcript_26530:68-772(+)